MQPGYWVPRELTSDVAVDTSKHGVSLFLYTGLMGLVDDLQSSFLLAKRIVENTEASNPVKVTYTIKTLAKEAASGEREERDCV